jgi:drug/metabolite transporter (DMT)-like permease
VIDRPGKFINMAIPLQLRGIISILAAGFCLTLQDAVVKWLTGDYPVGEILAIRGSFAMIFASFLLWRRGGLAALRLPHITGQIIRIACVVIGTFCFVTAIKHLPLATTLTITFAGPLIVTAMAPRFLGEHVGWRRWAAVTVGFAGVLLILRPDSGAIEWTMLLALTVAFTTAIRDVVTRRIAVNSNPAGMLFFALLSVTLAGYTTVSIEWCLPLPGDFGLFALTGVMLGFAQFLMIVAFRYSDASLLAPFKYVGIVWATIVGFLVWGDVPGDWEITGSALIIVSGLYILHRETISRRQIS